ncbi:hypothetical protein Daesc_009598 [Daldinia eschscholtzii]|uniref:Uncharacterized protein n=1 Tax=Daldinia eschscholtzii TaxID=292717 RepID=A0AAX6MAR4_9PEZI
MKLRYHKNSLNALGSKGHGYDRRYTPQSAWKCVVLNLCYRGIRLSVTSSWNQRLLRAPAAKPQSIRLAQHKKRQKKSRRSHLTISNSRIEGLHITEFYEREIGQPAERRGSFQATVPHDHIFSILGMISPPKDSRILVPISYNKTYEEVCGDVTKALIKETQDIGVLRLCLLQEDRSYVLN